MSDEKNLTRLSPCSNRVTVKHEEDNWISIEVAARSEPEARAIAMAIAESYFAPIVDLAPGVELKRFELDELPVNTGAEEEQK